MEKHLLFMLLIVGLFSSCDKSQQNNPLDDFSDVRVLNARDSIVLENYDILNPHNIYFKDSFLIFNSVTGQREIQLLDLKTEKVRTYHVIGMGKNEMAIYHTVHNTDSNRYTFADNHKGKIYEVLLDSLRQGTIEDYRLSQEVSISPGKPIFRLMETPKHILAIGFFDESRFGVFDKYSSSFLKQMDYPVNDEIASIDNHYKSVLYNGTILCPSSTGEKIVASCSGLLDFYSLSDKGVLLPLQSKHYHFPKFSLNPAAGNVAFKKEDKVGFTSLCSDEKYVYALYSGKTFEEFGMDAYNVQHLLVYDWDGNSVARYHLSKPLYGIAVYDKTLYGLSRENEPIVYCFHLSIAE